MFPFVGARSLFLSFIHVYLWLVPGQPPRSLCAVRLFPAPVGCRRIFPLRVFGAPEHSRVLPAQGERILHSFRAARARGVRRARGPGARAGRQPEDPRALGRARRFRRRCSAAPWGSGVGGPGWGRKGGRSAAAVSAGPPRLPRERRSK